MTYQAKLMGLVGANLQGLPGRPTGDFWPNSWILDIQLVFRSVDNIISIGTKMYCSGTYTKSKHNLFRGFLPSSALCNVRSISMSTSYRVSVLCWLSAIDCLLNLLFISLLLFSYFFVSLSEKVLQ